MADSTSTDDLNQRIIRSVTEWWECNRTPLLLSRLGLLDDGQITTLAKRYTKTLREYLDCYLSDRVQVVQHRHRRQLIGAIPSSVDIAQEGGHDALLEKTQVGSGSNIPRFHNAVWTAFRKPIDVSKRRFMNVQGAIVFRDVSPLEELPPEYVEIDRKYVVGLDADNYQVLQAIHDWRDENEIESNRLVRRPPERSHDLLDQLLGTLDINDLKRVKIPLDVVLKLRRTSSL